MLFRSTFLDFPLFLGIFQWDEPTKRVPFTAEPEIPEILTKWKAPVIYLEAVRSPVNCFTTSRTIFNLILLASLGAQEN